MKYYLLVSLLKKYNGYQGNEWQGSKVKGHTLLLKRNPKGWLHHDLSLLFQRCLSLGKLEHVGIQAAFRWKDFYMTTTAAVPTIMF